MIEGMKVRLDECKAFDELGEMKCFLLFFKMSLQMHRKR